MQRSPSPQAETDIDTASDDRAAASAGHDAFWQIKAAAAVDDNWLEQLDADGGTAAPVTTEDLVSPNSAVEFQTGPPATSSEAVRAIEPVGAIEPVDAWFTSLSDDLLPER